MPGTAALNRSDMPAGLFEHIQSVLRQNDELADQQEEEILEKEAAIRRLQERNVDLERSVRASGDEYQAAVADAENERKSRLATELSFEAERLLQAQTADENADIQSVILAAAAEAAAAASTAAAAAERALAAAAAVVSPAGLKKQQNFPFS